MVRGDARKKRPGEKSPDDRSVHAQHRGNPRANCSGCRGRSSAGHGSSGSIIVIDEYKGISPKGDLTLLRKLGDAFKGRSFLHVNSTREGGGVAEILHRMIPILRDLGIDARWEVIKADAKFYDTTKK